MLFRSRSLRSVTKLNDLGERTIWIDCDVIQADGGTCTASITGGFVALALALQKMRDLALIRDVPLIDYVAATSVGIVDGCALLDLAYDEDSRAEVDMAASRSPAAPSRSPTVASSRTIARRT